MLQPRVLMFALFCTSLLAGCQWGKSTAWSSPPPRRSDDPLLVTDAERKRPRDLYATTSDTRYYTPATAAGR